MLPTEIDIALLEGLPDDEARKAIYRKLTEQAVYKPIVVEGEDTKEPVSKYFGSPWLSEGEEWPELHGTKLTFVLQLDVATLPPVQAAMFGGTGLVQLFYETTGAGEWDDSALVRLVHPRGASSAARECNPGPEENPDWKHKVITSWEEDVDYARFEHFMNLVGKDLGRDPMVREYQCIDEDCLQGDKLGGWPFWSQGVWPPEDKNGKPMLPVMQLDAGCFYNGRQFPAHAPELFASDGTGHIFVSATDPPELKFKWDCG